MVIVSLSHCILMRSLPALSFLLFLVIRLLGDDKKASAKVDAKFLSYLSGYKDEITTTFNLKPILRRSKARLSSSLLSFWLRRKRCLASAYARLYGQYPTQTRRCPRMFVTNHLLCWPAFISKRVLKLWKRFQQIQKQFWKILNPILSDYRTQNSPT